MDLSAIMSLHLLSARNTTCTCITDHYNGFPMYWYVTFIHMVLSVDVKEAKQIPQTMQRLYTQLHTYCSDDNRNDVCDGL